MYKLTESPKDRQDHEVGSSEDTGKCLKAPTSEQKITDLSILAQIFVPVMMGQFLRQASWACGTVFASFGPYLTLFFYQLAV